MKKKLKKQLLIATTVLSLISLSISVPLIVYSFLPYYLNKVKSFEPINFDEEVKTITNENKNRIFEIIDNKKTETDNLISYSGDSGRFSFEALEQFLEEARNSDYKGEKFNPLRLPLLEQSLTESFYKNLNLTEIVGVLSSFDYFDIDIDWNKMSQTLDKFYDKEKGLFTFLDLKDSIQVSSAIFEYLNLLNKELFNKYYNAEKMLEIFRNYVFYFPIDKNDIDSGSGDFYLINLLQYIDEKTLEKTFDEKNIRSWIKYLDELFFNSKKNDLVSTFIRRLIFLKNIKPSTKNYYPNLMSEINIEKESIELLNSNSPDIDKRFKSLLILLSDMNFVKKNNLSEKTAQLLEEGISGTNITFNISLKNSFFAYTLQKNLLRPENNQKILNYLRDRLKAFEDSIDNGLAIPDESEQIYYMSLLINKYFKNDFNEINRFKNIINKVISSTSSVIEIWTLLKSIMLFQNSEEQTTIPAGVYRYIRSILNSFFSSEHKTYFSEMTSFIYLDKVFNFQIMKEDFFEKLVNSLDNSGIGFKHFSTSSSYSLSSTLNILEIARKYFSDNKTLLKKIEDNSNKLIEQINNNSLESLNRIEEFYVYLAIQKLLKIET